MIPCETNQIVRELNVRNKSIDPKMVLSSGTSLFQHIFSCWARIWPPFCSNFRAPLSKIHFFAIFGVKTPFLASSSVLLSHRWVFHFTLTRTDMNTGSMRVFWPFRNCRGLKTGQNWAKLTKISVFVKLTTVIQNFLANLTQSRQN